MRRWTWQVTKESVGHRIPATSYVFDHARGTSDQVGTDSGPLSMMVNGPPSYAATSTTTPIANRPQSNGHKIPSSDAATRTKILLLGLRRFVNFLP